MGVAHQQYKLLIDFCAFIVIIEIWAVHFRLCFFFVFFLMNHYLTGWECFSTADRHRLRMFPVLDGTSFER